MDLDATGRRLVECTGVGPLRFFDHRIALRECAEGTGLAATADIPMGTMVWMSEAEGEMTSSLTREALEAPDGPLAAAGVELEDYFAHGWVVDSEYYQGPEIPEPGGSFEEAKRADASNFLEHSSSPTIWFDGDHNVMARVDIFAGDATTYEYATTEGVLDRISDCACAAPDCRGAVTAQDWREPEFQQRYEGMMVAGEV